MLTRWNGIRAVTYDCWGTLLADSDWDASLALRRSALSDALNISEDEAADLLRRAWDRHDEAWKEIETFGPGRMAAYCLEAKGVDDDELLTELTKQFEEASFQCGFQAVDGAVGVLSALRTAGIGRALVCDTGFTPGRIVRQMLDEVGLLEYLDVLCFSDEVGVPKPGNEIFTKALAGLGVRPTEAVHVGDLRRTDIAGAHDVGMHAVRFRGVHDDRSDHTEAELLIDRHEQLLDVLGLSA